MSEVNSLSIIDQGDMVSFKKTIEKIAQWQNLVQTNLKEGKDYGTIPGTSKPTLYKSGAEKIIMLGKLRSTFEILDETKDWENEFFQFEIRWNLWVGENIIAQGVGLCSSKEDKYRYRWVNENRLTNNINKDNLPYRVKSGKYGDYKQYRVENEDICSIANTILKMAKKRAEIDAALLVGSLSELFTQDVEDLPEGYLGLRDQPDKPFPPKDTKPESPNTDLATMPQVNLIKKQIIDSHLITDGELKKISGYLEDGMTKAKASEIISWWLGDSKNMVIGERLKRESREKEAIPKTTKSEKIKQARELVKAPSKLEVKGEDTPFPDEEITDEDIPGSSYDNAIPFKGKRKAVSEAEDFISDEDLGITSQEIADEDIPDRVGKLEVKNEDAPYPDE